MEDLNAKYKKRFDEIYHDSDMLSYVGYNKESKKIEFMCKKYGLQSKEAYHLFNDRKECKKCNIEIIYYADYTYDFPYEVIKDKNKLLSIILEKK